jgi:hypothetical protein
MYKLGRVRVFYWPNRVYVDSDILPIGIFQASFSIGFQVQQGSEIVHVSRPCSQALNT